MRKHLLHWTTGLGPTLLSSQALVPSPSMTPVASPATSGRARVTPMPEGMTWRSTARRRGIACAGRSAIPACCRGR